MNNQLTPLQQSSITIRQELNLIGANARGLKGPGKELLPLKRDMLAALPDDAACMVLEAVELLFAACLQFVDAQLLEKDAFDAITLVKARIDRGQADGTIRALLHGPTKQLIQIACQHAPIAMHSIIQICPELALRDRLTKSSFH